MDRPPQPRDASDVRPPLQRRTFRFAPSPNGYLHLGHGYSALLNDRLARRAGGRLLLRIEDIDPQRCREDYVRAIEEDLGWLGLAWEVPVRRQSQHVETYAAALQTLADRGLAFPCFCTRGLVSAAVAGHPDSPSDPDGVPLYPGFCRTLSAAERRERAQSGRRFAWRLDMRAALDAAPTDLAWSECGEDGAPRTIAADPARWGDVMIARKDVPTSYNLSVVIDDAIQGVTDVVRGRDLLAATGLHRLLQALIGLDAPCYHHHRLILDAAGQKLSKSRNAPSLRSLRREGARAEDIRHRCGFA